MNTVKTRWTTPVELIKTVKCLFCENETGSVEWAEQHLAKTKHHLKSFKTYFDGSKTRHGVQFKVIERVK